MTDFKELAQLLFPNITKAPQDMEDMYPPRALKEGARVTRFAPSPTGFLHFGNLFTCMVSYKTAKTTDGVFYVRVEDTDQKRKVEGAIDVMLKGLSVYGINADEGVVGDEKEIGDYGPYYQSARVEIYQTYAKALVEQGLAYPCFCSADELDEIRTAQENESIKGYWGRWAKCRDLSFEQIKANIDSGMSWTLRLKSPGDLEKKCYFDDMIKGKIEMPENVQDVVLLKSDGIPTYHFAHAVDDHLMRTTHVVRGDEWISSVPIHLQLFKVLGFKPPKYAHVSPIMKEENGGKRKLSKRKDPEAAVTYYAEEGYPQESVNEYMMTLANSNFEDWRRMNKTEPIEKFPFNLKKMSVSGALFDIVKLTDVSKNVISVMPAEKVFELAYAWAKEYQPQLAELFAQDEAKATAILNIDREGKKPRKDIAKWSDVLDYVSYMYDETFVPNYELNGNATPSLAVKVIEEYLKVVNLDDDKDAWFGRMKEVCPLVGCTPNVKEYKAEPEKFEGHVGDVSTIIRVALTGRTNTPDLFAITALLGEDTVKARLNSALNHYKEEM
ncbi:MAG: glutamate--tRNA ligase [Eubacterium coprostanoligenes]|uniref:glutamate--tRNA ligase n=1 Tax=Eubacterium coprostanoligenes TaxID=290054 RepID=UPI002354CB9F|nr:glutamate--tRNA ligase [Eubacterium coprostanoligenes]MCI7265347.1 glutamate--tRNA ligase [Eubacterium coprostanoligenes]